MEKIYLIALSLLYTSYLSLNQGKIITSLDEINLWTKPEYMISNFSITYTDNDHFKYVVGYDHNVIQHIPQFWVKVFRFSAYILIQYFFLFLGKLQILPQNEIEK